MPSSLAHTNLLSRLSISTLNTTRRQPAIVYAHLHDIHLQAHVSATARSANCCAINPRSLSNFPLLRSLFFSITSSPTTNSCITNSCSTSKAPGNLNIPVLPKSARHPNSPSNYYPRRLHPKSVFAAGTHPIRRYHASVPGLVPRRSSFCATTSHATLNHPQRHPWVPTTTPTTVTAVTTASLSISRTSNSSSSFSSSSTAAAAFPIHYPSYTYSIYHSCHFSPPQLRNFHNGLKTRPRIPPGTRSHYPAKPTSQTSIPSSRIDDTHNNNNKHKIYTAAASTVLALIGIYSITDTEDSQSNSQLSFLRSLLDWWSPDHSDKNNNTTPPPTTTTPRRSHPAEMASTAPGRPETLTPEQEVKLKEFWNVTLSLFGQSTAQLEESSLAEDAAGLTLDAAGAEGAEAEVETEAAAGGSGKTKSKRSKLFSRSKKDKDKKEKDSKKDKDDSSTKDNKLAVPETTLSNRPSPPPGLTPDPEDKYNQGKDFKAALASQTPEELRTTFWGFVKYDNPDALLLRFLRARKWDVEKALVMMVSTMHWRGQEVYVEDISREGEATAFEAEKTDKTAEGFMKQLRMGKSYIHGTDKEERPVCYVNVRLHKAADQTPESLERYTIYLIETTRMLLKQPVDTAAIVFDMTGFGMANMDYTPVKFMIKCFEAHYPECLGICLVHNAPWIFQGIWKIIRGWLDPVVASKVHFTTKPTDLTEFISPSKLPKSLGGEEDWEYKYTEPSPNENPSIFSPTPQDTLEKETLEQERLKIIEEYEKNTREWIKEESKGAKVDTDVKDERSGLRERLRTNYWGLDRFLRARTWYDRIGLVGKNGEIDFYPAKKETVNGNGASAAAAAATMPAHTSDDDLD